MATTNYDRVRKAFDLLRVGMRPFVARETKSAARTDRSVAALLQGLTEDSQGAGEPMAEWDVARLLGLTSEVWERVFAKVLGRAEFALVEELQEHFDKWTQQEKISGDDTYRILDTTERLLTAISAPQTEELGQMKSDLSRVRFEKQTRDAQRRQTGTPIGATLTTGMSAWRDVATPHSDVASGNYQQAEFAADLWQVYLGEGTTEYKDPIEFFRRTYLTESLKSLLSSAALRLSGKSGDPVIQLQTNFGGGKTHSMLALYHLFSGVLPESLEGVESILRVAGVHKLPQVKRVVIVGNKISPGNPVRKSDGTLVRTLWGELAWQLGGKRAFSRVEADDVNATNPGDMIRELFEEYGPCLVLIDEWVAYARQLHNDSDLPGGSFETQFSFAQALTESAKLAKSCLLVVSLPASGMQDSPHTQADDAEVGGQRGREALDWLRNVVGRLESSWRPADAEESFEIVRRRLFEPMMDPDKLRTRDITARAFARHYREYKQEFPVMCSERSYEMRICSAYPIHPEVFDRLYTDWSTLSKFQRTRGVLRLMAAVIHCLWIKGDTSPLILPANIPIDDRRVESELTRYLPENWVPVIRKDIDGQNSLPQQIDGEIPNLGKLAACRRVARTIYLGSAPTAGAAHLGIEDQGVKLGCVMPGESPAIFGDALRRLVSRATYLYQDGSRFWYSTQPTIMKLAEGRAEHLKQNTNKVVDEIDRRFKEVLTETGIFRRVHFVPKLGIDVPDHLETQLVVLGVDSPCSQEKPNPALERAMAILEKAGTTPRVSRNSLVFLAPDKAKRQELDEAVRYFLAWESIVLDSEQLDLSRSQSRQAEVQREARSKAVVAHILETYRWLLYPTQKGPKEVATWETVRLSGHDALAVRAGRKLKNDEVLAVKFSATRLRMELDDIPLWRGNHVAVSQIVEDFATHLYLTKMQNPEVIGRAVIDGIRLLTWEKDGFGYADSFDETAKRYRGLRAGQDLLDDTWSLDGLLVRPEVAREQLDAEVQVSTSDTPGKSSPPVAPATSPDHEGKQVSRSAEGGPPLPGTQTPDDEISHPDTKPTRFYGSVMLSETRVGLDAGRVAKEVVAHLVGLSDAEVTVTLEIKANIPSGASDQVVRIITENVRALKFHEHGFEDE